LIEEAEDDVAGEFALLVIVVHVEDLPERPIIDGVSPVR
jgi:hypothetical protein